MDGLARLIGIAMIAGLVYASVNSYNETLDAIGTDSPARAEGLSSELADRDLGDAYGAAPQYLAFTPSVRSGLYPVADLEGSRDRDVEPNAKTRDLTYPIETDIVPGLSLAGRGELEPGLYATDFDVRDCSFQLRRIRKNRQEVVIGEDWVRRGRVLVTINEIEPDTFSAVPQCGDWAAWSPLVEPLVVAGDGDYWIGDLQAGTWTVPEGCLWEKVVGFRGASLWDVQESARGPEPLVVDDETLGVRIRNCSGPIRHESRI